MRQIRIILGFMILLSLASCFTHDPQQMPPDFFLNEEGGVTSQLLSDRVLSLAVDSRYLWIGTDRGLSRYDKARGQWDNFTVRDGLAHNHVLSIALDELQVWIGTRDGVSRYEMDTDTWTRYMPRDGLAGREVSCIAVDSRFICSVRQMDSLATTKRRIVGHGSVRRRGLLAILLHKSRLMMTTSGSVRSKGFPDMTNSPTHGTTMTRTAGLLITA